MDKKINVLCSGNIAMDYYGEIGADNLLGHFSDSHNIRKAVAAGCLFLAGKSVNYARPFVCSGITTWIHGAIGNDPIGKTALELAAHQGLKTELVATASSPTLLFAINNSGDTLPIRVSEDHASKQLPIKNIRAEFLANCAYLVTHAHPDHKNLLDLLAKAKVAGTKVVFNPAPIGYLKGIEPVFEADLVITNRIEAKTILSAAKEEAVKFADDSMLAYNLYETFGKTSIVTLDKDGVVAFDGNDNWHNSIRATSVVDTVGAGDAFLGFCVSALSFGHKLPVALRIGQTASSWVCERQGAQPKGITFDKLLQRLSKTPNPRSFGHSGLKIGTKGNVAHLHR